MGLVVALSDTARVAAQDADAIQISLKPTAAVSPTTVVIGQIAEVTGGDDVARRLIQQIDIADPPAINETAMVSKQQVEIRIRLAGFPKAACVVTGSESATLVLEPLETDDDLILKAVREPLATQFGVDAEDIEVRLAMPLRFELPEATKQTVRLDPVLNENMVPGRANIQIGVYADDKLVDVKSVAIFFRVYQQVPVTHVAIKRGEKLTEENVKFERKPISGASFREKAQEVLGLVARKDIGQGEVIRAYHVAAPSSVRAPDLIKRGTVVRMSTIQGRLRVSLATGEALQAGKLGDMIRIRNPRSKATVVGKVVGPGVVEVPF
ncbi:MAG: flagellar basal body P-ring formation chaperone FlgA, partial [Pirellulaceae bacterium]